MFREFDERLQADLEIALQRACSQIASDKAQTHETRRFIAERLIKAAHAGQTNLTELTVVARRAAVELSAKWNE